MLPRRASRHQTRTPLALRRPAKWRVPRRVPWMARRTPRPRTRAPCACTAASCVPGSRYGLRCCKPCGARVRLRRVRDVMWSSKSRDTASAEPWPCSPQRRFSTSRAPCCPSRRPLRATPSSASSTRAFAGDHTAWDLSWRTRCTPLRHRAWGTRPSPRALHARSAGARRTGPCSRAATRCRICPSRPWAFTTPQAASSRSTSMGARELTLTTAMTACTRGCRGASTRRTGCAPTTSSPTATNSSSSRARRQTSSSHEHDARASSQ
mmetsp:Transcript_13838/g.33606  ORF Transcript_13838/g.33606 Transcript_13838/m.33606 type:complete len:266 (+) Transcript_13838:917-1714(+)